MTDDVLPARLRRCLAASAGALGTAPDPRFLWLPADAGAGRPILRWGRHDSPLGPVLAAAADGALCWLTFLDPNDGPDAATTRAQLAKTWPDAGTIEDPEATRTAVTLAFFPETALAYPLPLRLRGTPFQRAIWSMLLRIPRGALVTYGDLAAAVGRPKAVRAAGSAVGANPVAVLVPCHRVISRTGSPLKYAGGPERKRALLSAELPAVQSPSTSAMP